MTMIERGVFWDDLASSLISVAMGYGLGFVIALPVAILMAWYVPVRNIINPWIQFIRNIPPLAYVPLLVACAGIGRSAQVTTITIACFLTMCVTIYQGVVNVDETLIKAARVQRPRHLHPRHRSRHAALHPHRRPPRRVRRPDDHHRRRERRLPVRPRHAYPRPEREL